MQKIPTVFRRDETVRGHPVIDAVTPGCEWVLAGEGCPTAKLDGQNVRISMLDGVAMLDKRRKPKERDYDMGSYVACDRSDPADRWLWAAFDGSRFATRLVAPVSGIYEAVGPHFNGNPHQYATDMLILVWPMNRRLVIAEPSIAPRTFASLREAMAHCPWEGIVFHHPDGRLAKIKRRDFGYPWPRLVMAAGTNPA